MSEWDAYPALMGSQAAPPAAAGGWEAFPRLIKPRGVPDNIPTAEGGSAGALTAAGASLADDPAAQINFFAQARGISPDRYGVRDGKVGYVEGGKFHPEVQTIPERLASGVGPAIPAATGAAAGILSAPMSVTGVGLLGNMAIAGAGQAGGQLLREGAASLLTGQKPSAMRIGANFLEGGLTEGVGAGINALAARGAAKDIGRLDPAAVGSLKGKADQAGIDLTPAELTNLPSLKARQKALGNLTDSADTMQDFYKRRQGQVTDAIDRYVSSLSPVDAAETAGDMGVSAARGAIKSVSKARSAAAGPLYDEAFSGGSLAPLEKQFETAFSDAATRRSAAEQELRAAEQAMTSLRGKQAITSDVYSSAGLQGDAKAAADRLESARAAVSDADATKNSALERLRAAQADKTANAPGAVWTPRIQEFLDDPIMKDGIKTGLKIQRLEAVAAGKKFKPSEYAIVGTDEAGDPIVGAVPNLRLLDAGKKGLDRIIQDNTNQFGQVNELGRAVTQFKQAFLGEVDNISPPYKAARAAFADASPEVTRAQSGLTGKLATLDQLQAKKAAETLFGASSGPQAIKEAKDLLQGQSPEAWQALKRSYIQGAFETAQKEVASNAGGIINVGGKFRSALLGSPQAQKRMAAALEPREFAALNDLAEVLDAAGRVKPIMSDTAWNQEMMAQARRDATPWLAKAAKSLNPLQWGDKIADALTESALAKNSARMAEVVTSPEGMAKLRELRMLSPTSARFNVGVGWLLGIGAETGAHEAGLTAPADAAPGALTKPQGPR